MPRTKCEHCGGEVPDQSSICPACGDPVSREAQRLPSSKKSGTRKLAVTVIGIVAALVLIVFLFPSLVTTREPAVSKPDVAEIINPEELRTKAERGEAEAQMKLGAAYARGVFVKLDYAQAAKWYRQAADQGHAGAQNALGELYEAGQGVPRNEAEAVKWYRRAAEQGYAAGEYGLAVMYLTGSGVPKDDAEALKWYRQAADQGYALAIFHLGMRYKKGQGVTPDPAEAYKWLDLAAARGIAEATEIRDELKRSMTRDQVAEGRRRAEAFAPKKAGPQTQ